MHFRVLNAMPIANAATLGQRRQASGGEETFASAKKAITIAQCSLLNAQWPLPSFAH
jgi:hypothetical protein